jgi:ArsR family transcriptional regulator
MLTKAGVLSSTKEGRTVFYEVRYQHLSKAFRELAMVIGECRPKRIVATKRVQNWT